MQKDGQKRKMKEREEYFEKQTEQKRDKNDKNGQILINRRLKTT